MTANPLAPTLTAMAKLPNKSSAGDVVFGRVAAMIRNRPGSRVGTEQRHVSRTASAHASLIPPTHAVAWAIGPVADRR